MRVHPPFFYSPPSPSLSNLTRHWLTGQAQGQLGCSRGGKAYTARMISFVSLVAYGPKVSHSALAMGVTASETRQGGSQHWRVRWANLAGLLPAREVRVMESNTLSLWFLSHHNWAGHLVGKQMAEGAEAEYLNMMLKERREWQNAFLFGTFTSSKKLLNLWKAKHIWIPTERHDMGSWIETLNLGVTQDDGEGIRKDVMPDMSLKDKQDFLGLD